MKFGINFAKSKPPKDRPWYHVLVDGSCQHTSVAEQNIELNHEVVPIQHADLKDYFYDFGTDGYILKNKGHYLDYRSTQ